MKICTYSSSRFWAGAPASAAARGGSVVIGSNGAERKRSSKKSFVPSKPAAAPAAARVRTGMRSPPCAVNSCGAMTVGVTLIAVAFAAWSLQPWAWLFAMIMALIGIVEAIVVLIASANLAYGLAAVLFPLIMLLKPMNRVSFSSFSFCIV